MVKETRRRRTVWIVLGTSFGLLIAVFIAISIYSAVSSVSVRFVNNTESPAVLTDCGPDLERIPAETSAVVNVFQPTSHCSVSFEGALVSKTFGSCLKMPSPLVNGSVVRISEASHNVKPCS